MVKVAEYDQSLDVCGLSLSFYDITLYDGEEDEDEGALVCGLVPPLPLLLLSVDVVTEAFIPLPLCTLLFRRLSNTPPLPPLPPPPPSISFLPPTVPTAPVPAPAPAPVGKVALISPPAIPGSTTRGVGVRWG